MQSLTLFIGLNCIGLGGIPSRPVKNYSVSSVAGNNLPHLHVLESGETACFLIDGENTLCCGSIIVTGLLKCNLSC